MHFWYIAGKYSSRKRHANLSHVYKDSTNNYIYSLRYIMYILVKCVVRDCLFSIDDYRKNWQTYVNTQSHQERNKHKWLTFHNV